MRAQPHKAPMGTRTGIYNRVLILLGMTKPAINIRFSQAIIDQLEELVDSGQYVTKADIVNQAVIEFLHRNGLRAVIRDEIRKENERNQGE